MSLLIKQKVTQSGLSRKECYVQLIPHFITGVDNIPVDRNIWKDRDAYLANPSNGTILSLDEIASSFSINMKTAPKDCQGDTVAIKMLYWINDETKKAILQSNPTWVDSDIEIVDLV